MLVLRPGALGDTLLAVPAVRALRRAFGGVTLAAHSGASRLLQHLGEVEAGLAFDDPALAWVFGAPHPPTDEQIVAWLSGPRPPALRHTLVFAAGRYDHGHAAQYLLETLAPLGIDVALDAGPLGVEPRHSDEVLVHPGSGSAAKNWPAERFAATIRALDGPARLIVGEADTCAADAVDAASGRSLPRLSHPSLEELAARLAGCRAYLGNDSGVSHLAGLCGARTVVLFGPTSAETWRPLGPDVQVAGFDADPAQLADVLQT